MLGSAQIVIQASGLTISSQFNRNCVASMPGQEIPVPAGNSGTLTTRTDNVSGVLTMADANHGIVNTNVIDIHWTDASGFRQFCYNAVAANVSGNSVEFSGAAGTVLPAQNTAIVADIEIVVNDIGFDGDNARMFAAQMKDKAGGVQFVDAGGSVLLAAALPADQAFCWWDDGPISNPLTGNAVAKLILSSANAVAGNGTFKLAGVYNSIP